MSASDRREQYLTIAADIAVAQGVDAVTMEGVAAGAGVNKVLVYRQFANRGELLLALYRRETAELDRRISEAAEASDTFEDRMRSWVHAWFDYVRTRGRLFRRLQEARTVAGQVQRPHHERQRWLHQRYGEWYARELGLPKEVARDAAAVVIAGLSGVIERWIAAPTAATRKRLEETYVEMMVQGLQALAAQHRERTGSK